MTTRTTNEAKLNNPIDSKRRRIESNEVKTIYSLTPFLEYPESNVNNFTYGCITCHNDKYSKEFLQRNFYQFAKLKNRFNMTILPFNNVDSTSFNLLIKILDSRYDINTYKNDIGKNFIKLIKLIYQFDSINAYKKLKQIMINRNFVMEIQDIRGSCDYCSKIKNKEFKKIITTKLTSENIEYDILEKCYETDYFQELLNKFLVYKGNKVIKMSDINNTGCLNRIISKRNRKTSKVSLDGYNSWYPDNVYVNIRFE